MGGSQERGWGALAGQVTLNVTDSSGDRISSITLSVIATVKVMIPKAASAASPVQLDSISPEDEGTKSKEITILQLDHTLYEAVKEEQDSNLFSRGKHAFDFSIDLPAYPPSKRKAKDPPALLPPSCLVEALVLPPIGKNAGAGGGGAGVMSTLFKSGITKGDPQINWASVKYQLKLTVHRTGMLKRNIRLWAPFVYLPPPNSTDRSILRQRRKLANYMAQIVAHGEGDGCQPIEAQDEWRERKISFVMSQNGQVLEASEEKKSSGILSSITSVFSKKPDPIYGHEAWYLSIPRSDAPGSFPLRSAIPLIMRCQTNKPLGLQRGSPIVSHP